MSSTVSIITLVAQLFGPQPLNEAQGPGAMQHQRARLCQRSRAELAFNGVVGPQRQQLQQQNPCGPRRFSGA